MLYVHSRGLYQFIASSPLGDVIAIKREKLAQAERHCTATAGLQADSNGRTSPEGCIAKIRLDSQSSLMSADVYEPPASTKLEALLIL